MTLEDELYLIKCVEESRIRHGIDLATDETLINAKRKYREHLRRHNDVKAAEAQWHQDGDSMWITFQIEWNADDDKSWQEHKQDVLEWAWAELATHIVCAYDCTGQWFTSNMRVAHLRDNIFVIYERRELDI